MSGECQVNVKSQSELDIGGRETCLIMHAQYLALLNLNIKSETSKYSVQKPVSPSFYILLGSVHLQF